MKPLLFLVAILTAGCATTVPPVAVSVSSFSRAGSEALRSYILLPAEKGRTADDLDFIEFSGYVERALNARGFQRTEKTASADLAIFLVYGIGDPKKQNYVYSLPVYGQTGVASSRTTGNVIFSGNTGIYSQTTTNTPQYGIVGQSTHTGVHITFLRHALLTAYDLTAFRKNKTERVVWETRIGSIGSSGDIRVIFPMMIAASTPYLDANTGRIVDTKVAWDSPQVLEVKGLSPSPRK